MKGKKEGSAPQNTFIDVIIRKLENQKKKFLVANAVQDNIPVIYCNDNFCNLSGYNRGDVIRRSACLDFLYGPLTSPKSIRDIKNALHDTKEKNISVLFYRRNGGNFRCNMVIAPVRNESGHIRLFVLNLHVTTDNNNRPLLGNKGFGGIKIPLGAGSSSSTGTGGRGPGISDFTSTRRRNKHLNTESLIPEEMENNQLDIDDDEDSINEGTSWLRNISKFIHHGTILSVLMKGSNLTTQEDPNSQSFYSSPQPFQQNNLFHKKISDIEKTSVYAESPDSHDLLKGISSDNSDVSLNESLNVYPGRVGKTFQLPRQISSTESDIYNINETKGPRKNFALSSDSQISAKITHYDPSRVTHDPGDFEKKDRKSLHPTQPKHISEKFTKMLSTEDEKGIKSRRQEFKIPFCTFRHDGLGKNIWDWFVLALVVYTAVFTPYSASFLSQDLLENTGINSTLVGLSPSAGLYHRKTYTQSKFTVFNIIDYIIDISFILDVFINFRTTYVNRSDDLIIKPGSIAVHYFKGWFLIDVISAVPFDFLLFFAESNEVISLMSLLKIARLLRLIRVVKKMNKYTENEAAFLLFLMTTFSLIAHWLACFWYAIGNSERKSGQAHSWLDILAQETEQDYANGGPTTKSKYITALYFTFSSLTSVGFGNVSPNTESEKVFSICVMLIGSLMYAGIFGHVSAIIQRLYSGTARYHTQMMRVKEFIRFHQIPNPLRQRLEEFFQHNWACTNGIEMSNVLHSFPEGIQADICLHLNQNLLSTNPAFKNGSEGYLRTLSLKFETTHVPPGDTLIHSGDLLSDLYFIARGSVEILSRDNSTLAILSQGDIFGEHPCLNKAIGKSKCNVRAMTYCDLHKINRKKILETLQMYPEFAHTFTDGLKITFDLRDELLSIALKGTEDAHENPSKSKSLSIVNQTINKKQFDNIYKIIKKEERKRPTEIPISIMSRISTLEDDVSNLGRRLNETLVELEQNFERTLSAILNLQSSNPSTSSVQGKTNEYLQSNTSYREDSILSTVSNSTTTNTNSISKEKLTVTRVHI